MDFIASDDDLTTAGLDYSMTAIEPDLEARALAASTTTDDDVTVGGAGPAAGSPDPACASSRSPSPSRRRRSSRRPSPCRRGSAMRASSSTTCSTAPVGNGVNTLEAFLSDSEGGRVGYCEQFASAMAVMARVLDIPARVAVGFLDPEQVGANQYEYSTHDLHAWPELYFEGAGWVRFEPTPGDRAADRAGVHEREPWTSVTRPAARRTPPPARGRRQSVDQTAARGRACPRSAPRTEDNADESGFPWLPVGGGLAGALLIGVAALRSAHRAAQPSRAPPRRRAGGRRGRSCGRRRSTCGWPGPTRGLRERPGTGWPALRRTPRRPTRWSGRQRGAEWRPRRWRPWTGSSARSSCCGTPGAAADEQGALRDDVLPVRRGARGRGVPRGSGAGLGGGRGRCCAGPRAAAVGQEREQARFGGVVEHI